MIMSYHSVAAILVRVMIGPADLPMGSRAAGLPVHIHTGSCLRVANVAQHLRPASPVRYQIDGYSEDGGDDTV